MADFYIRGKVCICALRNRTPQPMAFGSMHSASLSPLCGNLHKTNGVTAKVTPFVSSFCMMNNRPASGLSLPNG
jgi:hypothetical protein